MNTSLNPNVHLLQQVGLFQRGSLLITLPCPTSTYHTLALPQTWTWVAFKRIFDCLRKEGCEAYDIGTGNSCAGPFLWRWCKTLPNRTWHSILVNIVRGWQDTFCPETILQEYFPSFQQHIFASKAIMLFLKSPMCKSLKDYIKINSTTECRCCAVQVHGNLVATLGSDTYQYRHPCSSYIRGKPPDHYNLALLTISRPSCIICLCFGDAEHCWGRCWYMFVEVVN